MTWWEIPTKMPRKFTLNNFKFSIENAKRSCDSRISTLSASVLSRQTRIADGSSADCDAEVASLVIETNEIAAVQHVANCLGLIDSNIALFASDALRRAPQPLVEVCASIVFASEHIRPPVSELDDVRELLVLFCGAQFEMDSLRSML